MTTPQLFEDYPRMQQVVKELGLEPYIEEMEWHYFENIDNVLKSVLNTFEGLTSDSIPLRLESKERVTQEYVEYSKQLQVFTSEQARHELNLSNEDVTKLFKQVELGGARFM